MRLIARLFAVALCLPGAALPADSPDEYTTPAVFEFAFYVFEEFRITPEIGVVYEPVLSEHFGRPEKSEKREAFGDPTYRVINETISYDGVEIEISRAVDAAPSDWTWLNRVRITSPKYRLRHGLRVGESVAAFEERLGPWRGRHPDDRSSVSFDAGGFCEPGGVTHAAHGTVTLELDGTGTVTAVDIEYWAD